MEAVIKGIERGDKASIALGLEFIEEDGHFSNFISSTNMVAQRLKYSIKPAGVSHLIDNRELRPLAQ